MQQTIREVCGGYCEICGSPSGSKNLCPECLREVEWLVRKMLSRRFVGSRFQAGETPSREFGRSGCPKKAEDREILEYLRAKVRKLGRPPKAKECLDGPVGPGTIARRFGGWKAALRTAGINSVVCQEEARRAILEELRGLAVKLGRAPRQEEWRGPVSVKTVIRLFGGWADALEAAGLTPYRNRGRCFDPERARREVTERIQALAKELGRTPTMKEWCQRFGVSAILNWFGTWNTAVEAAGLVPNRRRIRPVRRRVTDEEALESLKQLAAELGRRPMVRDLDGEVAVRLGCPSHALLCQRFGSLGKALAVAGLDGLPRSKKQLAVLAAARQANELAGQGFVVADEVQDPLVRRELRKKGIPVLRLRGRQRGSVRVVLKWLLGRAVQGVLPSREEIRSAMGERAFVFFDRWTAGASLAEVARKEGLSRERVCQIVAQGARRAVRRLLIEERRKEERRKKDMTSG